MPQDLRVPFAFSYNPVRPGISVPIILVNESRSVDVVAPIDTGADYCFFERSVGEELGLIIEEGVKLGVTTVNSRFDTYGHEVTILTFGFEIRSTVYFYADPHIRRSVLGRRGWLDRVRLGLVDHDCELYLAPYNC